MRFLPLLGFLGVVLAGGGLARLVLPRSRAETVTRLRLRASRAYRRGNAGKGNILAEAADKLEREEVEG